MAQRAPDRGKNLGAILNGLRATSARARRRGLIEHPHECCEHDDVARNGGGIAAGREEIRPVLRRDVQQAALRNRIWRIASLVRKQFVRNSHLDVVGFAGKEIQRLVLSFPTESGNRSVVSIPVWLARNPQPLFQGRVYLRVVHDRFVRNRFDHAQPEERRGNPEDYVSLGLCLLEIRLLKLATLGVSAAGNRKNIVDTSIRSIGETPVRIGGVDEARFTNRAIGGDKRWNRVGRVIKSRYGDLRVWSKIRIGCCTRT